MRNHLLTDVSFYIKTAIGYVGGVKKRLAEQTG
jgi:hypothetical protein